MKKQYLFFLIVNLVLLNVSVSVAQNLKQAQDFVFQSDYNSAIQILNKISHKAKKEKNTTLYITAQNNLADAYIDMGAYYKAHTILDQNCSLLKNLKSTDYLLLAQTHYLRAFCYDRLNRLEDYLKECNTFYKYYKKAAPQSKIYKALYFAAVGRYYNLRLQVDKAYEYTSAALKIYNANKKEAHLVDKYLLLNAHLFSLRFYDTTYEERMDYQDSLVSALNKKFPNENVKKAIYYRTVANINLDIANNLYEDEFRIENANIAIIWYNKAQTVFDSKLGFYNPNAATVISQKVLMLMYKKEYEEALKNCDSGIQRITYQDTKSNGYYSNNNPLLMGLLGSKAMCYKYLYEKDKDIIWLHKAEECLLSLEKAWINYADHTIKNKKSYNNNGYIHSPYSKLTDVYYNLYLATSKKDYLNAFFKYDEKSKYTSLLENLYYEKFAIKRDKHSDYYSRTAESFDDLLLSKNNVLSLKKDQKEYEALFKSNFEKYSSNLQNIFQTKDINTLNAFQKSLNPNEAFISINYSRKGKERVPYLFLITNKTSKIIKLKSEKDFIFSMSDSLVEHLNNNDIVAYKKMAHQLYLNYFKPVENYLPKNCKHIKISPDSNFTNLPFEILLYQESTSSDFSKLPYLIKKYQFSYGLSSTIEKLVNNTHNNSTAFTVFSPDFSDKKLSRLNEAKTTSKELVNEYNGNLIDGTEASLNNFKKHLKKDKVLAILSHGKSNASDDDGTQKGVYLADGFLSLNEVYNYTATTDFLILASCETGNGYKDINEGNINLARAFTSIGVKSMLLASWAIDESSSMKIISSFLKYLDEGDTKSAALQKAKLEYLATANPRTANPLYWAGLNITGTDETVKLHNTNYFMYAVIIIPLLLGFFILRKRRKKS